MAGPPDGQAPANYGSGGDPVDGQNASDGTVEVRVPFDDIAVVDQASFDGVTAGLRVNESVHSPLLCMVDVFDIASGDLSLPGKVTGIDSGGRCPPY